MKKNKALFLLVGFSLIYLNNGLSQKEEKELIDDGDLIENQVQASPQIYYRIVTFDSTTIPKPERIKELSNVSYLKLKDIKASQIPEEIWGLENLKELTLYLVGDSPISESLGRLKLLKSLDVRGRDISKLPPTIGGLINLEKLYLLSRSKDFSFPQEMNDLENLKEIVIRTSRLEELNFPCNPLSTIESLDIYIPEAKKFSHEIFSIINLKKLSLVGGHFEILPSEIGNLKNLTYLNFSNRGKQFQNLPKEIGKLKKLERLNLAISHVKELPIELGELTNLETLNLVDVSNLEFLPESIGQLKSLKRLKIKTSKLKEFPVTVANLKELKEITYQSDNTELAKIKVELPSLEKLVIKNTMLKRVNSCWDINLFRNLKELRIRGINASEQVKSISTLKQLETLILYDAGLAEFPKSFTNLTYLKYLYLERNEIDKIPKFISDFKHLKRLRLRWNPIKEGKENLEGLPFEVEISKY